MLVMAVVSIGSNALSGFIGVRVGVRVLKAEHDAHVKADEAEFARIDRDKREQDQRIRDLEANVNRMKGGLGIGAGGAG
jgi:hypothetical protein